MWYFGVISGVESAFVGECLVRPTTPIPQLFSVLSVCNSTFGRNRIVDFIIPV